LKNEIIWQANFNKLQRWVTPKTNILSRLTLGPKVKDRYCQYDYGAIL